MFQQKSGSKSSTHQYKCSIPCWHCPDTFNSVTLNYFTVLIASPKKNMRKANNNANFFYNMRPAFGRNVAHRPHTLCSFILFF